MVDAVDTFLHEARFDEWGVPDRKVPDCPQCEEDELCVQDSGRWRKVACGVCSFKRELTLEAGHG